MTDQPSPIKVAIAGAAGKMGREAIRAMVASPRFQIVGGLVRSLPADNAGTTDDSISFYTDAEQLLLETKPEVWLDFTDASSVVQNINLALNYRVRPVIGATGYSSEDLDRWRAVCDEARIGAIAAPNFAIGALLMIKFAKEAAQFYQQAEIIELHHAGKKDAPSGTARRTAESINQALANASSPADLWGTQSGQAVSPRSGEETAHPLAATTADSPARGLRIGDIAVHSIRLPGLIAHQEVIFGGNSEVLTIRHDSMARTSFMPGVLLACSKVTELSNLVYGLENLLW